jgi:hypothetical protein
MKLSPGKLAALLTLGCALASASRIANAQAQPTAIGPGSYLQLGVTGSRYQQDYGHRYIDGETAYLDANLFRRIGFEAEIRFLNAQTSESVKESTFLIGPKISIRPRAVRPYVKLLAGDGTFRFPFHYANPVNYFVLAPGGGLDWRVGDSKWTIRVVDFEYQIWPQFTFGALHPYGASAGFSYQLFEPRDTPRGHHF